MYILVNGSRMILGLFQNKTWLSNAIQVVRMDNPDAILYYQKVKVNSFNTILPNFWTMHPEKLIEIGKDVNTIE